MDQKVQRLDGWKAIAAHFRRDRTTVMRWEKAAALPVRRVPGDSASVYAFVHELEDWLAAARPEAGRGRDLSAPAKPGPPTPAEVVGDWPNDTPFARQPTRLKAALPIVSAAITAFVLVLLSKTASDRPMPPRLPRDAEIAKLYVQARDDWASRTPDGIAKSLGELAIVTRRDPGFAPGFSGLSDAYLLAREFAGMPSDAAYANAETSAKVALAIDPYSSAAARDIGFIDYYFHHDNVAARSRFTAALRDDPGSSQTYLWYGNALSDNGQTQAGLRMLEKARSLDPGSQAIEADYAFALWKNGDIGEARRRLIALSARSPDSPDPHNFLATIALVDRDFSTYLNEADRGARLAANQDRIADLAVERRAFEEGGTAAILAAIGREWEPRANWGEPPRRDATILAALASDRSRAITLLREADADNEVWRGMGWVYRAVGELSRDPEAARLLDRRRPPSLGADGGT